MASGSKRYSLSVWLEGKDYLSPKLKKAAQGFDRLHRPIQTVGLAMQATGRKFQAAGKKMLAASRRITLYAVGMATAISYAIVKFTRHADQIGKIATRLQISTDAYQRWVFVAEQSGVEAEAFKTSLERMARSVGEAATGTGEAKDAFKAMGISIVDVNGKLKTNEQMFHDIIEGLARVDDEGMKAAYAADIFGRAGVRMLNMLRLGTDGVNELGNQLEDMGGILSEETIRNSEKFNDALNLMKKQVVGVAGSIIGDYLPAMIAGVEKVGDWIKNNKDLIRTKVEKWIPKITIAAKILVGVVGVGIVGAFLNATGSVMAFTGALMANPFGAIALALTFLGLAGVLLVKKWDWVKAKIKGIWNAIDSAFSGAWRGGVKFVEEFWAGVKRKWGDFKAWIGNALLDAISFIPGGRWIADKLSGGDFSRAMAERDATRPPPLSSAEVFKPGTFRGKVEIELTGDGAKGAKVRRVEEDINLGIDVDAGLTFATA